jgi:hypothetical protein
MGFDSMACKETKGAVIVGVFFLTFLEYRDSLAVVLAFFVCELHSTTQTLTTLAI